MGGKEGRLPKQSSHSYKHGKENKKKEEKKKDLRWESIRQQEWQWRDHCGEIYFSHGV